MTADSLKSQKDMALTSADSTLSLERLLEFEIAQMRSDAAQPGWTQWALLGTLGGLLWLTLEDYGSGSIRIQVASYVVLTFSLLAETWRAIRQAFGVRNSDIRLGARFFPVALHERTVRPVLLSEALRAVGLVGLSIYVGGYLNYYIYVLVQVIYIAVFLLTCVRMAVLLTQLPIPAMQPIDLRGTWSIDIIGVVATSLAAIGAVVPLVSNAVAPTLPEIRFAGLVCALVFVATLLATVQPARSPLLQVLVDIRREFALGYLTIDEAKKKTEIVLLGMSLTDLMQDDAADILFHFDRIRKMTADTDAHIDEVLALLNRIEADGLTEKSELTLMLSLQDQIHNNLTIIDADIESSRKMIDPFYTKLKVISGIMERSLREMPPLTEAIKTNSRDAAVSFSALKGKQEALAARVRSVLSGLEVDV